MAKYSFEVDEVGVAKNGQLLIIYSEQLFTRTIQVDGKKITMYDLIFDSMQMGGTHQWNVLENNSVYTVIFVNEDVSGNEFYFKFKEDDIEALLELNTESFYMAVCVKPFLNDLSYHQQDFNVLNYTENWIVQSLPIDAKLRGFIEENYFQYVICISCGYRMRIKKGLGTVDVTCPKCGKTHKLHTGMQKINTQEIDTQEIDTQKIDTQKIVTQKSDTSKNKASWIRRILTREKRSNK